MGQPIIATPEIKDHGRLRNSKILWVDEAFPDEIEKIRHDTDEGNKDYAVG